MKAVAVDLADGQPQAPTRPPTFAECYVCGKQFGSRSIGLHEPKCLERWRATNGALPAHRRTATPVRLAALPGRRTPQPGPVASLTASWPSSNGLLRAAMAAGPRARAARPQTTTLSRPKVLDADHADQLDMSTRRCSELLALASLSGRSGESSSSGASGSSSSSSSSSGSSSSSSGSSPDSEASEASSSRRAARPGTMRLGVGPRDLHVPNIEHRARTAVLSPGRSRSPLGVPVVPGQSAALPTPCVTCGKTENPERFHSHPEEGRREPARAAPRRLTKKRLSIHRPVPVRFRPQPTLDPAAQRKQQQREKKRAQQRQQQEDEAQQRLREQEQQRHLAVTLTRYGRSAVGPTFIVCYVCGRQFGPTSLPIHQPQCLERWFKAATALPRRKRGPAPKPPDELPEGTPIDEYNQLATHEAQRVSGENQEKKKKRTPTPRETPTPRVTKSDESLFFIEF